MEAALHTKCRVVSGSSSFWYDNWDNGGILHSKFNGDPPVPLLTVAEFLEHKETYLDCFSHGLHADTIHHLKELHMDLHPTEKDQIFWMPTSTGNFTIRSAYELIRSRNLNTNSLVCVWSKYLPMKINVFAWRFVNRLLPLADNLTRYGFHLPSQCQLCDSDEETVHHTFWGCGLAAQVWLYFGTILGIKNANSLWANLQLWWSVPNSSNARNIMITILPSLILWEIWRARNNRFFEAKKASTTPIIDSIVRTLQQLSHIHNFMDDGCSYYEANQLGIKLTTRTRKPPLVCKWIKPERGKWKLNVDGAFKLSQGGTGYIIRDCEGLLIEAAGSHCIVNSAFEAELQSILLAFQRCKQIHHLPLRIECDNLQLVTILQRKKAVPWRYCNIFQTMFSILQELSCTITHTYRESNAAADYMANLSMQSRTNVYFNDLSVCPRKLRGIICLDQNETPYVRYR